MDDRIETLGEAKRVLEEVLRWLAEEIEAAETARLQESRERRERRARMIRAVQLGQ